MICGVKKGLQTVPKTSFFFSRGRDEEDKLPPIEVVDQVEI